MSNHAFLSQEQQTSILAACLSCFSTKDPAVDVARAIINTYEQHVNDLMFQVYLNNDTYDEDDYYETHPSARVQVWLTPKQRDNCNYEGGLVRSDIDQLKDDINEIDENKPRQYAIPAGDVVTDNEAFNFFLRVSDVSLEKITRAMRDEDVDLNSHEKEVLDEVTNYASMYVNGFLTALVDITLDTVIDFAHAVIDASTNGNDAHAVTLTLPAGSIWGIFDPTAGSGSLMECTTANDTTITMEDLIAPYGGGIHVNEKQHNNYGYCVMEVYGDFDSATELTLTATDVAHS